ncbi:MAG: nucleotide exchange factor GrpE [Candidatus Gracilibacteria bacterium]|nr:nucleotide exchange factor GrpE [Candidatus Gracilibacteria bacterium]
MTKHDKDIQEEKDLFEEMQEEVEEIEEQDGDSGEINEGRLEEAVTGEDSEVARLKDALARQQADYDNFKKRVERDKSDMMFFLKSDILKKILPRIDDLERIVKNTPEDMRSGVLYEGVVTLEKTLRKDLESMGVKAFESIGHEVDADKHDVMTTVPGKPEGIIADEFEKGYMLDGRVLRHAKVVVGAGE